MCNKAVFRNPFKIMLKYCHDSYKTQEMCDKVVDNFQPALTFVLDWFVKNKIIKNFILLRTQMIVYTFLMKNLVISHFVVMKWVF